MDVTINPRPLEGRVDAVASKSVAHRMLVLASLAEGRSDIDCATSSRDIDATVTCARALGARVARTRLGFRVSPLARDAVRAATGTGSPTTLDCGESGSTLRFLLPVACALGGSYRMVGAGRLTERPLSPLWEQLVAHGARLEGGGRLPALVSGGLAGGEFRLPGDVSSQYVSGLLMAAPLLDEGVCVLVEDPFESRSYVDMTIQALSAFGVRVLSQRVEEGGRALTSLRVPAGSRLRSPGTLAVEGDWSNAAFWLAAGALGGGTCVRGLDLGSCQGDRAVLAALAAMGARIRRAGSEACCSHDALLGRTVGVADIPDLVPPLAAVAAYATGETRFAGAGRLRLKESDRLESVGDALRSMGARVRTEGDDLVVEGAPALRGGVVESHNDHRIAMMAAVAASAAEGPTTIRGAECVSKSYPGFWEDFAALGGVAEKREG